MHRQFLLAAAVALGLACGADPKIPDAGTTDSGTAELACTITAPTSCPSPTPKYADVKPIIDQRCVVCHDGATWNGPWPLTDYQHVADWADVVRSEILNCSMPQADAGFVMPDEEKTAILNWIRCGYPQ